MNYRDESEPWTTAMPNIGAHLFQCRTYVPFLIYDQHICAIRQRTKVWFKLGVPGGRIIYPGSTAINTISITFAADAIVFVPLSVYHSSQE